MRDGGGVPFWIKFVAEALLVTTGQVAGARGAADRIGDIAIAAADAGGRETIEVRSRDVAGALEADVVVAEIVGDDEEDVGPRI